MQKFKDSAGKEWALVIDPFTIEKVREKVGLNLYDLKAALGELFSNPPAFVNAVYLLCCDQVEEEGVSERAFCRGFNGDTVEAARQAFVEEMIFFSPKAAREHLTRAAKAMGNLRDKTVESLLAKAEDRLRIAELETDSLAERQAEEILAELKT